MISAAFSVVIQCVEHICFACVGRRAEVLGGMLGVAHRAGLVMRSCHAIAPAGRRCAVTKLMICLAHPDLPLGVPLAGEL